MRGSVFAWIVSKPFFKAVLIFLASHVPSSSCLKQAPLTVLADVLCQNITRSVNSNNFRLCAKGGLNKRNSEVSTFQISFKFLKIFAVHGALRIYFTRIAQIFVQLFTKRVCKTTTRICLFNHLEGIADCESYYTVYHG